MAHSLGWATDCRVHRVRAPCTCAAPCADPVCSPVASFILKFYYSQTGTDRDRHRQTEGQRDKETLSLC
eukprot:scaffold7031_cov118-Isochrysis_galbana.AAC.2